MHLFKADLHIHTVLSPCGDLEMSPRRIVQTALGRGLDIIAITDHNSTLQCEEVMKVGKREGLSVICGVEVTSAEEVHCLTLFENLEVLRKFQGYLDRYLPEVKNKPEKFGYQVWVNEEEEILGQEERMLIHAIDQGIEEVAAEVERLGGLFIPAHVDKTVFSLYSQLGFMPSDFQVDGIELSPYGKEEEQLRMHPELKDCTLVRSSDAHFLGDIGKCCSFFKMKTKSFEEIKLAFRGEGGREIIMEEAL